MEDLHSRMDGGFVATERLRGTSTHRVLGSDEDLEYRIHLERFPNRQLDDILVEVVVRRPAHPGSARLIV